MSETKVTNDNNIDDAMEKIKEIIRYVKFNGCPVWQCGGELEYLEGRINWQTPDMKCKNCGAVWKFDKKSLVSSP